MKRQFFFHGNPSNSESTAINMFDGLEDKIHSEFFKYGASIAKSPYMLCEIRKWKEHYYSVYSYFHDGRDYSKRHNGHCILTLIVEDSYCRHIIDIYNLMVLVYETGLRDALHYIDNVGDFLISSFYGQKELEYLQQDFYNRLDETQFTGISSTFQNIQNASVIETFNPNDVDSENFMKIWQRDGRIVITENRLSYVDNIISLEQENAEHVLQINSLEKKIENLSTSQKNNRTTERVVTNNNATINKLKDENRQLANKVKELELKVTAKERNAVPSSTLPPLLQQIKDALHDWYPFIVVGLLIINIMCTYSVRQENYNVKNPDVYNDTIVAEKSSVTEDVLKHDDKHTIDSLNNKIKTLQMFMDANISIKNIRDGNTLTKNKTYNWKITDVHGFYKEKLGVMKVNGEDVESPYTTPKSPCRQDWTYYYQGIEVKHITINVK